MNPLHDIVMDLVPERLSSQIALQEVVVLFNLKILVLFLIHIGII